MLSGSFRPDPWRQPKRVAHSCRCAKLTSFLSPDSLAPASPRWRAGYPGTSPCRSFTRTPSKNRSSTCWAPNREGPRQLSNASFAVMFSILRDCLTAGTDVILEGNFRPGEHEGAILEA